MKLLKESKEKLPLAFLTSFISKSWDEVGILKEEIKAIKDSFTGTKKVEEIIQPLIDAYLVCLGQLELHVKNKDYLDLSDESKKLKEDVALVNLDPIVDTNETKDSIVDKALITPCSCQATQEQDTIELETAPETDINININVKDNSNELEDSDNSEEFEYFCDFADPIPGEELSDTDLYPQN